jgi:hypothetical protein
MSFSLMASTGIVVKVWRQGEVFYAERPEPAPGFVKTCPPIDLSAVIAELAGLDLDDGNHAWEASKLAAAMHQRFETGDAEAKVFDSPSIH